jgi:hypothetical protein
MTTTPTRRKTLTAALGAVVAGAAGTARRSQTRLIVLALALGAILLSPSATVAHAAPGGGPGDESNPPSIPASQAAQVPLQVHASENPVIFSPFETSKTITFTWNPVPQTAAVVVEEDGQFLWIKQMDPGSQGPLDLTVTAGKTYTVQLKTVTYQIGPPLTITTKKPVIITTAPEMPEITINPR